MTTKKREPWIEELELFKNDYPFLSVTFKRQKYGDAVDFTIKTKNVTPQVECGCTVVISRLKPESLYYALYVTFVTSTNRMMMRCKSIKLEFK